MPKKLKLNLKDLRVQSFVTALTDAEKKQFIGGDDSADNNNSPNTARGTYCDCNTVCANTCAASCGGTCGSGYVCC